MLGVSPSGFYAWQDRPLSARAQADAALQEQIQTVFTRSRRTYGAPWVHAELRALGVRCGRKRVARLMREAGLVGAHRRRPPRTTWRDRDATPAPDLVQRQFRTPTPDRLWVADITYVGTGAGWLYLAVVLDVCRTPSRTPAPRCIRMSAPADRPDSPEPGEHPLVPPDVHGLYI